MSNSKKKGQNLDKPITVMSREKELTKFNVPTQKEEEDEEDEDWEEVEIPFNSDSKIGKNKSN